MEQNNILAYGVASERVNETLIRLGNISAGLSIPLGDLVYLYGTTMTQGRLFTQDLRQFMGRGIPLADELAKQFGVTKDQVGELVTAGRVGFPEVQKAIEAMTNEGGKFHNLMEEQSKTITGQISNLEDAWATMLNNIGKSSEGAINTALDGAAYLIENYESVLKVIGLLITAYGSYKAAIIVTATAQKVMASIDSVQTWLDRTKMLTRATQAQILFNKAVSANPYVIVALAITGLVAGIYALVTAETAGERAQRKYNDSIDDFNQKLEEKRARIEQLISIIQDETQTHFTQVQAYDELGRLVPALTEAYTLQELKTLDLASAQKILNTERDEAKYRNLIDNVNKYSQELTRLNELYKSTPKDDSNLGYALGLLRQMEETEKLLKHAKSNLAEYERLKKIAEEQAKPVEVRLLEAKTDLNQIQKEFDAAKKKLEEEQAKIAAGKSIFIPIEVSIMYDFQRGRLLSAQENVSNLQNEAQTKVKNYGVEYLAARKEWEAAKRELRKIELDKNAFTKEQYDSAKKREKNAKDAFLSLGGNTSKDIENNALKKQQSLSYALIQAELDLQEQRIAVMRDGRNKRLAEIDLEYRQTAAKIKKEKEEAQKNGATKDQLSVYDDQITTAEQKRIQDRQRANKEYAIQIDETYRQLGDVFVSEEARKTRAAEKTYQAMRDKALEDLQAGNISGSDFILLNAQIDNAEAYEQMQDLVDAFGNTQDKITNSTGGSEQGDQEQPSGSFAADR